jgi:ClpP class serine protease
MMACVGERIIAAPFAILGSIGVVAQLPNFNRFLRHRDIDVELHTAGTYKRTLTVLGENTPEGRAKFQAELDETHQLFKTFVHEHRPTLDIDTVATGEHWYGAQALSHRLADEICTSDDYLLRLSAQHELYAVRAKPPQPLGQRLPIVHLQDHPQMRHRHHMFAHLAGGFGGERLPQMHRNLVAKEGIIDPSLGRAALGAAQHIAVEGAGLIKVANVIGKVEGGQHGWSPVSVAVCVSRSGKGARGGRFVRTWQRAQ